MASDAHGIIVYPEQDGILNERCAYVLVAIGRGSHEQGIRLVMPQWGANGSFSWPNGVTVTFYNRLVFVLRPIGYKERPRPALAAVTPESLGVPLTGIYVIALCSGPARTGDISAWASGGTKTWDGSLSSMATAAAPCLPSSTSSHRHGHDWCGPGR